MTWPTSTASVRPRAFLIVAVAAVMSGCASGVRAPTPDVRTAAAYEASAGPTAPDQALDRWWLLYGDAQLTQLVDRALTSAPDARAAAARLGEARAVRRSTLLQAVLPSGDLRGSATRTDTEIFDQTVGAGGGVVVTPGTGTGGAGTGTGTGAPSVGTFGFTSEGVSRSYALNFDVSWELDLFGRIGAAYRTANADLAAARFDYESTRASLAANIADSLFAARGLAIQLGDSEEALRIQRELARVTGILSDRGLGTRADADRAAALTAQREAESENLRAQLQAAKRSLLVLVGAGPDPTASLAADAEAAVAPTPPTTLPSQLLARRPDVRRAEAQLASAAGRLSLADKALFPTFTLTPGVGLTRSEQPGYQASIGTWSIGLGLLVPILDRPRLLAEVDAQGARAEQAAVAYEQAVQTAFAEAENALVQLAADQRQVTVLTTGEARARAAYDAARRGFQAGLTDLTTVLNAEQTWRQTRAQLTGARVTALRRSAQAFKAVGGGWAPAEVPAAETRAAIKR